MLDPLQILNKIWKTLFDADFSGDIPLFQAKFCADIPIPIFQQSISGTDLVASSKPYPRLISQSNLLSQAPDGVTVSPATNQSLDQIVDAALEDICFCGDNVYNSSDISLCDNIFGSTDVHCSRSIHNAQHVVLSANSIGLEYAAACDSSGYSQFVIRAVDSGNCCRCFDIYQSGKCSNAYFISNCYDVHDSILCYNLRSKRYCIGNRQFSQADYNHAKPRVLERLLSSGFRPMYQLIKCG
ncbi:MAG: hypothetical protein K1X79_08925 [Oligoflexia bacterium]|nr:hypothetical protein [Oligoflexia bacterium]